jgi:molybdopterin biosynthesis enzyme
MRSSALVCHRGAGFIMPRVKTELLQAGMQVASDVKNIDNMLLIPAGAELTERHIGILEAWGVTDVEVQVSAGAEDADPLAKLPPEVVARLTAEIKSRFWQADESNPVYLEVVKLMLHRRAAKGAEAP